MIDQLAWLAAVTAVFTASWSVMLSWLLHQKASAIAKHSDGIRKAWHEIENKVVVLEDKIDRIAIHNANNALGLARGTEERFCRFREAVDQRLTSIGA